MKKVFVLCFLFLLAIGCGSKNETVDLIPQRDRVAAAEIDANFLNTPNLRLKKLKGKVVVLDFFATWCGPCRMEIPSFIKLYSAYHSSGLEIIGLTVEAPSSQPPGYFNDFLRTSMINYPVGFSSDGTTHAYGVEGYPTTFFIDKTGKVAEAFVGIRSEEEITGVIEGLLAE